MRRLAEVARALGREIGSLSEDIGRRVEVDDGLLSERSRLIVLSEPGERSANGSCRMVRAADGWLAVNLPRESDFDLLPAWIDCAPDADPWPAIEAEARVRSAEPLVEDAQGLGLAVARIGSVQAEGPRAPLRRKAAGGARPAIPRVVDLSSLWAGPLCGALLAQAGCDVVKVESASRPDTTRASSAAFHARLNGAKACRVLDFANPGDRARLRALILDADVVITNARPRAFGPLGLTPEDVFAANPRLVWVAISGYGWTGPRSNWVGFGDDAAAAGGLVRWSQGAPLFLGDAVADPLTGLAAAAGAMRALTLGGGFLVDAALARTAAGVAAEPVLEAA
jgi:hypothetical protein